MSLTTVDGSLISSGAITLTTQVTGTLPVANGGTGVTTSTGSGAVVLGTSPTLVTPLLGTVTSGNISACTSTSMVLVTPVLGTPTSGNLANCTGIPAPAALSTASGSAPSYSARAWVNFNGTGTVAIRASGNVSSITDNGTGDYTVNFTTAMSDVNYSTVGSSADNNGGTTPTILWLRNQATAPTTSAVRVGTRLANNTDGDSAYINIAVFR